MPGIELSEHPLHLGLGATAEIEPPFTGEPTWYENYAQRHEDDGFEARLVSMHSFDKPWDVWEVHPRGAETAVFITAGAGTKHRQRD